jgi:hypothetical protein
MVTEADWKLMESRKILIPYLDVVFEAFGTRKGNVRFRLAGLPALQVSYEKGAERHVKDYTCETLQKMNRICSGEATQLNFIT